MSKKETKNESKMNKKTIIIAVVAVVVVLIILCVVLSAKNKSSQNATENEFNQEGSILDENGQIDYSKAEVYTIKFKIKNSLEKNISKVYLRDNTNENFSNEVAGKIAVGEEAEAEYGNYSPLFIWDLKVVYEDGTSNTLNSLLAANVLYDGATLDLVKVGEENIEAINHDMVTYDEVEEQTDSEEQDTELSETEEVETEPEVVEEPVETELEEIVENTTVEEVNEVVENVIEENTNTAN